MSEKHSQRIEEYKAKRSLEKLEGREFTTSQLFELVIKQVSMG